MVLAFVLTVSVGGGVPPAAQHDFANAPSGVEFQQGERTEKRPGKPAGTPGKKPEPPPTNVEGARGRGAATETSPVGTVKSITSDLIVLRVKDQDLSFTIADDISVTGPRTSAAPKGGRAAITKLVAVGDTVTVTYIPRALEAKSIRVISGAGRK